MTKDCGGIVAGWPCRMVIAGGPFRHCERMRSDPVPTSLVCCVGYRLLAMMVGEQGDQRQKITSFRIANPITVSSTASPRDMRIRSAVGPGGLPVIASQA